MFNAEYVQYTKGDDIGEDRNFETLAEAVEWLETMLAGRGAMRVWINNREIKHFSGKLMLERVAA